jgi:hypothetical protein
MVLRSTRRVVEQHCRQGSRPTGKVRQFGQQHKKQEKEMSVIDRQAMAKSGLRYYHWSFAEAARGKKQSALGRETRWPGLL